MFVTLLEEFLSFLKTSTNFFVIPFLDMTPEYELEKQPSRGVIQTGVLPFNCFLFNCTCNEIPWKISVTGLTFSKFASKPSAWTLLKIPLNEFFKDINNNNGTPCFEEWLLVAAFRKTISSWYWIFFKKGPMRLKWGLETSFSFPCQKLADAFKFVITQVNYAIQQKKVKTICHLRETEGLKSCKFCFGNF